MTHSPQLDCSMLRWGWVTIDFTSTNQYISSCTKGVYFCSPLWYEYSIANACFLYVCCASKKIPFTGRYDAATKKGVFCSICVYVNNSPQYLLKEKKMIEWTNTYTHAHGRIRYNEKKQMLHRRNMSPITLIKMVNSFCEMYKYCVSFI